MTVGEPRFAITLADTEAARGLAALLLLTLDMEELNGNEKHGELPQALPTDASQPGTIRNGDLLLWGLRASVLLRTTINATPDPSVPRRRPTGAFWGSSNRVLAPASGRKLTSSPSLPGNQAVTKLAAMSFAARNAKTADRLNPPT
ncbi:hypothetical protein GCM10023165_20900 [Variovorax defluvii]|uniref:Cyclophilin-like domain-containing protein n=1 Tax=Variovorax defluvii TaxID=913761 RepID=A0ABP8HLT4_9BURK